MLGWITLLATLSSSPEQLTIVRIDRDRWPERIEKIETIARGEIVWSWSSTCAPSRRDASTPEKPCNPPTRTRVTVIDANGKAAANADVRWGTRAMLDEIPDALLPVATTDQNGVAMLATPSDGDLFARVAGPKRASAWETIARANARLRAFDGAPVHIVCTDESRKPAKRMMAELELVRGRFASPFRAAASEGAIDIPAIPRSAFVRLLAWGEVLAPRLLEARVDELPQLLVMPNGATARGRLTHGREGVSGDVELRFLAQGVPIALRKRTRSAADGFFEISGIPPGAAEIEIDASRFAAESHALEILAGRNDLGTFTMRPARTVRLRLIDDRGRPVAGAEVIAECERVRSDDRGFCELVRLPRGEAVGSVKARGCLPLTFAIPEGSPSKPIDVELITGARITAELVRSDGTPAGPGTVLLDLDGHRTLHDFDANGRLDIGGLLGGTFSVEIKPADAATVRISDQSVRLGDTFDLGRLTVDSGLAIRGTIVGEDGAQPIAGARIRLFRPSATTLAIAHVMKDWVETTASDDGSFEIRGLAAGPHLMLIDALGRAPVRA